jgi:hypothetical protein
MASASPAREYDDQDEDEPERVPSDIDNPAPAIQTTVEVCLSAD